MNFYFCEACGKRITEVELTAGEAKDKKLKGVYCTECSTGVQTTERMPLHNAQPKELPEKAHLGPSPQKPVYTIVGRSHSSAVIRKASRAKANWLVISVSSAAFLFVLVIALDRQDPRSASLPTTLPQPPLHPHSQPAESVRPAKTGAQAKEALPLVSETAPAPDTQSELLAQVAFEKLDGLGESDRAGKIAALNEFLIVHGDTIVANRARELRDQLARLETSEPIGFNSGALSSGAPAFEAKSSKETGLDASSEAMRNSAPLFEYTLTLQEGQPIPEAGIEKFTGTQETTLSSYKKQQPLSRGDCLVAHVSDYLIPLIGFTVFAREGGFLPNDAEILEAKLYLHHTQGGSGTTTLRRVQGAWNADEATWFNAAKEKTWKAPGGDYANDVAAQVRGPKEIPPGGTSLAFDVTNSLRAAQKERENFGWRLHHSEPGGVNYFASSRHRDAALRPRLVLKVRCAKLPGDVNRK